MKTSTNTPETNTPAINTRSDVEPGLAYGFKTLLIGAPLIMAVGRALLVPLDDQDWDGVMTSMAANQARSDAGWLLALAASGLLGVTAVMLAGRLRVVGKARMAMFVTVTTALGWAASAAISFNGLYLSVAATAPDRAAQVQIQQELNDAVSTGVGFLMVILAVVGYIVLAVGLARSALITRGAAILIAVGGAATLITTPGPLRPLLVLTALLLATGHGLATRTAQGQLERRQ
jgi:hypothetical protein